MKTALLLIGMMCFSQIGQANEDAFNFAKDLGGSDNQCVFAKYYQNEAKLIVDYLKSHPEADINYIGTKQCYVPTSFFDLIYGGGRFAGWNEGKNKSLIDYFLSRKDLSINPELYLTPLILKGYAGFGSDGTYETEEVRKSEYLRRVLSFLSLMTNEQARAYCVKTRANIGKSLELFGQLEPYAYDTKALNDLKSSVAPEYFRMLETLNSICIGSSH